MTIADFGLRIAEWPDFGLMDYWINGETSSMIRVTQIVEFDEKVLHDLPDWTFGRGSMITLDLKETESAIIESVDIIRVHRPDGTFIDRVIKGITLDGTNVGTFLPNTRQHEVPVGSEIELPPFCIPLFPVETP